MPRHYSYDDDDRYADEAVPPAERSYPNRGSLTQPSLPSIIDTSAVRSVPPQRLLAGAHAESEDAQRRFSRRDMLAWGGGALAAAAGLGWISQTKVGKRAIAAITPHAPDTPTPFVGAPAVQGTSKSPLGYFHAFFEVNSPAEVDAAAALGINYTIAYSETSWDSADVNTSMGKALLRHGMKTFVNLEYPYLRCVNNYGQVNGLDQIRNLVIRFRDSPLTAGYWIKDDDCTDTGDEQVALIGLYNLVRSLDPNPQHLIMPGFGDAGSFYRNYAYGCCDLIGFYPYPAYSRGPGPETKDMLKTLAARTPPGMKPPPFIGIYQDFASPEYGRPVLPVSNVVNQVATYMGDGAVGVAGFGWNAPNESHIVANDATLRAAVPAVTQWLINNGYGTK
jgi:hypothetical protein